MGAEIKGWWDSLNRFTIIHIYIMIMPEHLCILIHKQIKPWSGKKNVVVVHKTSTRRKKEAAKHYNCYTTVMIEPQFTYDDFISEKLVRTK